MMRYQFCFLVLVWLFVFCGCNSGLRTEYIDGIVTLDGEPIAGALVTFIPLSGEKARIAAGDTNTVGKYVLTAPEGGKPGRGTTQGEYKVTIAKRKPVDDPAPAAVVPTNVPPSVQEMAALDAVRTRGLPPPFAYITPKKYSNADTSGLTVTVVRGKNHFDFAMVSEGK